MAWEWLAPLGAVVGAGITAGIGTWCAGRKIQNRQHKFERETSILMRGREKAEDAIAALRVLMRHRRTVARWHIARQDRESYEEEFAEIEALLQQHGITVSNGHPDGEPPNSEEIAHTREAFERLGGAIEYLTDPVTRQQIERVYDIIEHSYIVRRYGETDLEPELIVWHACTDGLITLDRYLRDEPAQDFSPVMLAMQQDLDNFHATRDSRVRNLRLELEQLRQELQELCRR